MLLFDMVIGHDSECIYINNHIDPIVYKITLVFEEPFTLKNLSRKGNT